MPFNYKECNNQPWVIVTNQEQRQPGYDFKYEAGTNYTVVANAGHHWSKNNHQHLQCQQQQSSQLKENNNNSTNNNNKLIYIVP